jgi:hypothetical protein
MPGSTAGFHRGVLGLSLEKTLKISCCIPQEGFCVYTIPQRMGMGTGMGGNSPEE